MPGTSLEAVAEAIPHIVWLADVSGADYFNTRGTDFTGSPRKANYGDWVELVHPEDAERARFGWICATRRETPLELTYRIRRSDGVFCWHIFRAMPVRSGDGRIAKWIGTADEVSKPVSDLDDDALVGRQITELCVMLEVLQQPGTPRFGHVNTRDLRGRVNATVAESPTTQSKDVDRLARVRALAPREQAVARLIAHGHTNAEVANLLGYSLRTIEISRARLRLALGAPTRADLVRLVREAGLMDDTT